MSKDILLVKNITREGPGLFEDILRELGVTTTIVDLDNGDVLPTLVGRKFKAIVVFGGSDSANDPSPKMTAELEWIKRALAMKMPYLGICLGMQTLVKAAGGTVMKAPVKEVGLRDSQGRQSTIELTGTGKGDPLLRDLAGVVPVFHLHGETVALTDNMQLLGTGKYCENQIIRVAEKTYGIQSHFELTEAMLRLWAAQDPDLQPIGLENLLADFNEISLSYTQVGRTIFNNFLSIADLL